MGVLVKLIKDLNQALGLTTIIVSHDVAETLSIADYIYVISGGRVIGQGNREAILASDSPLVQQFISGSVEGPVPFHYPAPPYREDLGL